MEFNGIKSIDALIQKKAYNYENFKVTLVLDVSITDGSDVFDHNEVPVATNQFDTEEKVAKLKEAIKVFIDKAKMISSSVEHVDFEDLQFVEVVRS